MRAGWYEQNGSARDVLKIGELPDVEPAIGEVRVKIAYSGVNPSDVKRRAGWNGQQIAFPQVVPNNDGAGVIDQVGEGVDPKRIGERVWLHSTGWRRPFGTAATYSVTPSERAIRLPDGVSFTIGAGLGVPAMTAHRAVFGSGPVQDKIVLVSGGAGAVGFYAIQLAKWAGATVISTASGGEKSVEAKRAGADHVINYKTEHVVERLKEMTADGVVDHIVEVDFAANLAINVDVLRDNGSIATYASMSNGEPSIPFYRLMAKNMRLLWVYVYEMPHEAMMDAERDINAWLVSADAAHPNVHSFTLAQLADAHLAVENGAVGKVLVEVSGETP